MTVPEHMRKAMGIETGTELVCIQTASDTFECHVLPARMGLREYLDTHTSSDGAMTQEEIDAAVEEGIMAEIDAEYGAPTGVVVPEEVAHGAAGGR
jgi:bifunctional DNA-binding transcriptional regulator/antitoxin component of YhaV-PrlF toxin-antitoxin module